MLFLCGFVRRGGTSSDNSSLHALHRQYMKHSPGEILSLLNRVQELLRDGIHLLFHFESNCKFYTVF